MINEILEFCATKYGKAIHNGNSFISLIDKGKNSFIAVEENPYTSSEGAVMIYVFSRFLFYTRVRKAGWCRLSLDNADKCVSFTYIRAKTKNEFLGIFDKS